MDGQDKFNMIAAGEPGVSSSGRSAPRLDPEKYADDIREFDFTEDQAREFLETMWSIMMMLADLGLGVDAVSLACGQDAKHQEIGASQSAGVVELDQENQSDKDKEKEA